MIRSAREATATGAAGLRDVALAAALALALVLLAAPAAAGGRIVQIAEEPPATLVTVDKVDIEPLSQTVPVIGRLVARRAGVVASRSAGPVGEMLVDVGDRVKAGDVLAVLVKDAILAQHALARAELKIAQQALARLEKLRRSKSAAFTASRYEVAIQEVAKAKANQALAEIVLYNADIRAPYDGVVSVRHTEIGSWLAVGQSVVALVNDTDMEVETDVPANRIAALVQGTPVTLELADGSRLQAQVRAVVPSENPRTRTRVVRFSASFDSTIGRLAAGQSVTVYIPVGVPREIVSVHKDAVINRGGKNLVYLVDGGAAQIRPVQLGEAVGGRFEVVSGLEPGDLVVVRGNERLRPGQKIRYERGS